MKFSFLRVNNLIKRYRELPVVAKAGLWFLICNFIQKGMAAITTPIFTRLLTTAEYGRVSVFYSWADLLGIFITFGLSSAVYSRGIVKNSANKSNYTKSMIGLALLTSALSFLVVSSVKIFLLPQRGPSVPDLFGIYPYVIFCTITEFWYQQKKVDHDYVPFVILTLTMMILKPLISIVGIICFPSIKVEARIIPDIAISGIVAAALFVIMVRKGERLYDKTVWKESLFFVVPLIPHYLSQRILSQSDRLMIQHMIGDDEAGIYSLAYSIGMLLVMLTSAIDSTVAPWAYKKINDKQYGLVSEIFEKLQIEYGLCSLCFCFFAPEVVHVFAPNSYHEAIYIIPVIALSSFFMFSYLQFIYFEYFSGKTQYSMIATLVCAVVNLILNYILIQRYGYVAAAYTTLLCYVLYFVGHYFISCYLCKKFYNANNPFNILRIVQISLAFITFTGICLFIYDLTIIRIILGVICTGITVAVSIKMVDNLSAVRKE